MVRLLNRVAHWLPLLALICFAGAVVAAHRRRRVLVRCALASATGMLVLSLALLFGRHVYLSELPLTYLTADDAGRLFDTVMRFLRIGIRIVFILALLVWAIAWLTGPSRQAHAVRRSSGDAARAATARWSDSRLAAVAADKRESVSFGIVALAALILVLWTDPGLLTVIVVGLVTAALVVLVYSLRPPATATQQP